MWVRQPKTTICDFDTHDAAFRVDLKILLEGVGQRFFIRGSMVRGVGGKSARSCGHLPNPEYDCSDRDDGQIVSGRFFVSGCNSSELLEL